MEVLAGIRVLDLSRFQSGPVAGMFLGDMGAEVIRIEDPEGTGWLDFSQRDDQPDMEEIDAHHWSGGYGKRPRLITLDWEVFPYPLCRSSFPLPPGA